MTTRSVIPITAALICAIFVAACDSGSAPSKACIEAAKMYAEALDQDQRSPENEKSANLEARKQNLAMLEDRKVQACGE